MEAGFDLSHELRSWVSPSLIEANHILSLSRQDLQIAVLAELDANPALEQEDLAICPACGTVLDGLWCPVCRTRVVDDLPGDRFDDGFDGLQTTQNLREDGEDLDPLMFVAQGEDIRAQIVRDARAALCPRDFPIAEYLIENIDERGLLSCDLGAVADLCGRPVEEIEAILKLVQELAPVGVAARNLEESLLLQTQYLAATGEAPPRMAEAVISGHLRELGAHRFSAIARELGARTDEIEAVRDFIRERLNPFPLQSSEARSWRVPSVDQYVAPDVVISLKDGELTAEIVDTSHFHLRINAFYTRLSADGARRGATAGTGGAAPVTAADRDHARNYSHRARLFINNIQQRRDTLLRITQCIMTLQDGFLLGGVRDLRPLTRAIVAQNVGAHESTVSRATSNKFVMLPNRKVIPFSDFFTPSLSTKDVIKEILLQEQRKGGSLTDLTISSLLDERGIRIARRTVAKYRAELGILPSTMR